MARHPPLRHRVQQLSTVPVALWRRLVGAAAFALGWLTVWVPGAAVATTLACLTALWVWAGTASSLEQALALARPWVPALQTLALQDADASLRNGGRIGQLAWRDDLGLSVSAQDIEFNLDLRPLLKAEPLQLELQVGQLTVQDDSPPSTEPPTPLQELTLPLDLQVALSVDRLTLAGPQPVDITHLRGQYRYDGEDDEARHTLSGLHLELAQGRYDGNLALQAQAPMALNADIQGLLTSAVPALGGSAARTWDSALALRVRGQLSHENPEHSAQASLRISASLGDAGAPAQKTGPSLTAEATLQPWQSQPVHSLKAQLQRLDLAAFWPQLPTTLLSGDIQAQPPTALAPESVPAPQSATQPHPQSADSWHIGLTLNNGAAGPIDQGRLPLTLLKLEAQASPKLIRVPQLQLRVGQGGVQGQGQWVVGSASAQAQLTVSHLALHELHTGLSPRLASGQIALQPGAAAPGGTVPTRLRVDLSTAPAPQPRTASAGSPLDSGSGSTGPNNPTRLSIDTLKAEGEWTGQRLLLSQLLLRAAGAQLRGQGSVTPQPLAFDGQWRVQAPGLDGKISGSLGADSGQGDVQLRASDLTQLGQWVRSLPLPTDTALPNGLLAGDVALQTQWQGGWTQAHGPTLKARITSQRLAITPPNNGNGNGKENSKEKDHSNANRIQTSGLQIDLSGNLQAADIALTGRIAQGELSAQVSTQARASTTATGGLLSVQPTTLWLRQSNAPHALSLHSTQAVTLDWRPNQWQLSPGSLQIQAQAASSQADGSAQATPTPAPLALTRLHWQQLSMANGTLSTRGEIDRLALDWLDALPGLLGPSTQHWLADAGVRSDLVWGGQWRVDWPLSAAAAAPKGAAPNIQLSLKRLQGDLSLRNADASAATPQTSDWIAAGLQRAEWQLRTEGDGLTTQLNWASQLAGNLQAQLHAAWVHDPAAHTWTLGPQTPVRGSLSASTPDMALWSPLLAPPGWRARGRLALNAQVGGTLSQPDWRGELNASELALRSAVEGLEFANGRLVAQLSGERIDITQLSLDGPGGAQKGGTLTGKGHAQWHTSPSGLPQQAEFHLQASASKLRVSSRADRRLMLSGDVSATLAAQKLQLRGQLAVDQALFILPDETAPALGDDVVVRQTRVATPEPTSRIQTDMLVRIDLGQQLEVRGQGLQTQLGGQVSLISTPSAPALRVLGEVTTQQGSYRAYGQQLRISEGVVRFSGPYDDPGLNILAVRNAGAFRDSDEQVVGVRITGSARMPLVKLYAKPDMPDGEKLAWLVLGRPASGAGAEAAVLQQAALALLSRNGGSMDTTLASRLGLDEIAFRGSSTRADGTTQNAGVALGKRLSQRLYVVYETGMNAAMGTVSLLYDVSRRLTLRTRAGEENAVDLLFTIPHD